MQRATPQLSEAEMSFDFFCNPVSLVHPSKHTQCDKAGVQCQSKEELFYAELIISPKNLPEIEDIHAGI